MIKSRFVPLLAFGLLFTAFSFAADILDRTTPVPSDEPVPVLDFFRPGLFDRASLNHAGTHVAALTPFDADRTGIVIADLETNELRVIRGAQNYDVYEYHWLTNSDLLFSVSHNDLYAAGIFLGSTKGQTHIVEKFSACRLVGVPQKNPLRPLIWVRSNAYDEGRDAGVLQLDAKRALDNASSLAPSIDLARQATNSMSSYGVDASVVRSFPQPDEGIALRYLTDRSGELAYAITALEGEYSLWRLDRRKWLRCPVDFDDVTVIDTADDPDELIVLGPFQDGKPRALQRLNPITGELGEVLHQDDKYDPESVSIVRHPKTRKMLGIKIWGLRMKSIWFDATHQKVQELLDKNFRGEMVSILDCDEKQNVFLIATYSDRKPPIYHRLVLDKMSLGLIKNSAPWIDPARTVPMQMIEVKVAGGERMEGFLTLPRGASKENPVPLIALPHGGPWANDTWGWDSEAQFFASRGYAVFQPNYRGSTGYDWKFADDLWDFRKMHDDVTAGVKGLLKTGLFDSDRVAIMGTSFGGYLAVCGASFEPDLYKCAVTVAGVFDWELMINDASTKRYENSRFQFYTARLGDPKKDREKFDSISPLRHVAAIKIPLFVAHGKDDSVVNISQSKQLINELDKHTVTYEKFFASREGHGMAGIENEVDLYSAIEAFLAHNL